MIEKDPFELAEKIFRYHTGELDQAEQDMLEAQIAADPALKALVDELGNTDHVQQELQQLNTFDAKRAYAQALETVYPVRRIPRTWYIWAAASIALIAAVCVLLFRMTSTSATDSDVLLAQQDTTDGVQLTLATGERIRTDTLSFLRANETGFTGNDGVLQIQTLETTRSTDVHTISVPYKKKYQVVLSDGSKVFLNAGSTLTFPAAFGADERRVQLVGEAFFEVAPMPGKQFVVEAGQQQIRVYGTVFNVKAYADEPIHYTTLIEGRISLQSTGKELFLQAGNEAQFDQATGQTRVSPANLGMTANWKEGWLAFDNLPMDEILRQIGRWYNLEMVVADQSLHAISATGKIRLYPDVNEVLRKFEKLDDIRFVASENRIVAKQIDQTTINNNTIQ